MSPFPHAFRFLLVSLGPALALPAGAVPVVVFLESGSSPKGELVRVTNRFTELRTASGGRGTIRFDHEEVDRVDFPPMVEWERAMSEFVQRNYEEAAEQLEAIARAKTPANYYPAPENFSTLAERRLLDCYRRLLDPERLAPVARRIDWSLLGSEEREVRPVAEVWATVGEGKWSAARLASERVRNSLPRGDDRIGEISYLEGRALEQLEQVDEALIAYGRTIGIYPGADRRLARDAIQRSVALLHAREERHRERNALLLLYAESFGGGSLWDGALREWDVGLENAREELRNEG